MNTGSYSERINFHYANEPATPLRAAHGVWGGVNPHGEIEMCFYDESSMPPAVTIQEIGPDGITGDEMTAASDGERHIARTIHTRLVLNYNTARAVCEWLEARIAELESETSTEIFKDNAGPKQ